MTDLSNAEVLAQDFIPIKHRIFLRAILKTGDSREPKYQAENQQKAFLEKEGLFVF